MPGRMGAGRSRRWPLLARYPRLSKRRVRTCLDRLEADVHQPARDPAIMAAGIKRRPDRRPQGWDPGLSLARDDLDEPDVIIPGSPSPTHRAGTASPSVRVTNLWAGIIRA